MIEKEKRKCMRLDCVENAVSASDGPVSFKKYVFLQMRWIRLKMLLGGGGIPDLSMFFLHSRRTAPGWLVVIFDVMKQNEFLQAESRFSMQSQEFQVHWVKCSFSHTFIVISGFFTSCFSDFSFLAQNRAAVACWKCAKHSAA